MPRKSTPKTNTNPLRAIPLPFFAAGIYLIAFFVIFVISFRILGIPIAAVGLFVVLEALLAALLNRIPLWIHGLVVIAHLIFGGFFSKLAFMALMAVLYVGAICLLYLFGKDYD